MKLLSYYSSNKQTVRSGWMKQDSVYDLEETYRYMAGTRGADIALPVSLLDYIHLPSEQKRWLESVHEQIDIPVIPIGLLHKLQLAAPIPRPPSFRDFYAFEGHVKTARKNRGLDIVPEWYDFPVFYFSNTGAVRGHNESVGKPSFTEWLDYELEIACVIGKEGINITREDALDYIEGFMILNDWSARDVQRKEVKVGLGPAKAKDFATSMGPYLVTKDELEDCRDGEHFNLEMTAVVNGRVLSRGNVNTLYFSFSQMIERASQDCTLYPGDVIGSGTVATGCILELGTHVHRWLEKGDVVELSIERLGKLRNEII